jgi:hypothetical protein
VLAAEPSGAYLHLFLNRKITSVEKLASTAGFEWQEILPSLEDVFIAQIRKEEASRAA